MNKVIVTDINMKFISMVKFMIKWVLASLPAMIVLVMFYAMIYGAIVVIITAGK